MSAPIKLENNESPESKRVIIVMSRRRYNEFPVYKQEYAVGSNDFEELLSPDYGEYPSSRSVSSFHPNDLEH